MGERRRRARRRVRRVAGSVVDRVVLPGAPRRTHAVDIERDIAVEMSDGVILLGDLHLPVGGDPAMPTALVRSPYGRTGLFALITAGALAARGIPAFIQSCRGTFGSGGTFTPMFDEQRDGVDTIRWLRRQDWFTGRLLTFGMSYLGFVQWAVAGHLERTDAELAPDALCLNVTMPALGPVAWHEGAFGLRLALLWTSVVHHQERRFAIVRQLLLDRQLRDAYDRLPLAEGDTAAVDETVPFYQDWLRHEAIDDPYWAPVDHTDTVSDVTAPVSMVSGWYDILLPLQMDSYARLVAAGNPPDLTIGPWGHPDPRGTGTAVRDAISLVDERFGSGTRRRRSPVRIFVTGLDEWRDLPVWPPPAVEVAHHLQPAGGFTEAAADAAEPSRFRYDPADPTPAVGGPHLVGLNRPVDNRELEARPDVLSFTGAVLDGPVDVIGHPTATIHLRSDRPSADVFVRICDVHPDGRSYNVTDGIRRIGSPGTRPTDPEPDADGIVAVEVRLWPTAHRFRAGHRLRIQVSSGAHPRFARNTGTGEPAATDGELHVAHQEVFHDRDHPSVVHLPIVSSPS